MRPSWSGSAWIRIRLVMRLVKGRALSRGAPDARAAARARVEPRVAGAGMKLIVYSLKAPKSRLTVFECDDLIISSLPGDPAWTVQLIASGRETGP